MRSAVWASALLVAVLATAYCATAASVSAAKHKTRAPAHAHAPKATVTNVHMVCHTHDDVGWLKTVDQYYLGANNSIQFAGVQYVLDSVMPALEANPQRKFIYVEIAFFIRWWREQTPDMQQRVKKLVANGQLEFINGGWCMNDEAATHYYDIVDQMTRGHAFLQETFGVKPTIGWHIDPFGHSAAQAELFSLMKFDAFFFGRIDYQDKNARLAAKNMETIWRPSSSLGADAQIFAGVTFNGYGPPDGFNWDVYSQDEPINDDPRLEDVNVGERADAFANWVRWAATFYATPNVMLTLGSDFEYTNANTWYKNLDKLLKYMTGNPKYADLNLFYSTPSQYLKAVNAANPTLTVKSDDFFPYSDWEHAMWTGYFTSRVALKGYVRQQSSYLQSCKQLEVLVPNTPSGMTSQRLIDAMAVAQHHDAVSGTSKQHVAFDYAKRLSIGQADCAVLTGEAIGKLATTSGSAPAFTQCPSLNVSVCAPLTSAGAGTTVAVAFYNNIGRARDEWVRLPSATASVTVLDATNTVVPSQVLANTDPAAAYWVTFQVAVPQFGFATYFLEFNGSPDADTDADAKAQAAAEAGAAVMSTDVDVDAVTAEGGVNALENDFVRITFNAAGGLASITNKAQGLTVNVNQTIAWYKPSKGTQQDSQASGAYIFRPDGDSATPNPVGPMSLSISTGPLVQTAVQTFSPWASQTIRLYVDRPHFEVEYNIGPIDISDNIGKEVITRWQTDMACDDTFFTDSNGREMQKRVINYRPTWPLQVFEPVAGNYYPVNSAAALQNSAGTAKLLWLNDRSQGGGGVVDGELEIMLHRRLLADDARGVGEPLNETDPATGKGLAVRTVHVMVFDSVDHVGTAHRLMAEQHANPLNALFANAPGGSSGWMASHTGNWSALSAPLPAQVHLQTVQALPNNRVLLRLEHMFEKNESSTYSQPVTVDLAATFFGPLRVSSAVEVSLSANQPAASEPRYHWKTVDSEQSDVNAFHLPRDAQPVSGAVTSVTLYPMQIRSFILS